MTTLPADFDFGEFVLYNLLLPCLGCLALFWCIAQLQMWLKPRLWHWWLRSGFRLQYQAASKAQLVFLLAVTCNVLAALLCLPLLRVPPGSGIKPMGLILFSLILNVAAVMGSCKTAGNPNRANGSVWLGLLGVVLCLTPFLGAMVLMHLIASWRALEFG